MTSLTEELLGVQTFGGIDASSDRILLNAFEDHAAYKAAIDCSRPIVIGRKGSGKSAVFKKITSAPQAHVRADGFTFSDYPWEHHAKQKQSGVPEEECYRESWKYFISLMLCKLLLKYREEIPRDPVAMTAVDDIARFVKDTYGTTTPELTRVFTPGQKIKLTGKIGLWGVGGEAKTIDVENLPTFYSEVNRNILDAIIRCAPKNRSFYICFDELDFGFDPKSSEYLNRLIGLIRAAKYTNDRLRSEGITGAIIVLLRDDIWHTLRFEDKNKLTQDQVSEIQYRITRDKMQPAHSPLVGFLPSEVMTVS